jgi:Family of unknown function (DUF695)
MQDVPDAPDPAISDTATAWRTGGTARKGQQYFFGFNPELRKSANRSAQPIRVEVWIDLHAPFSWGLVDRADLGAVFAVEQTLRELIPGRAVVAAQVSTTGNRSYLLYTADAGLPADLDQAIRARVADHAVHVRAMHDQKWNGYASVVRMGRRNTTGMVILACYPLLAGVLAARHYGAGWGAGQAAALYIWIGPLVVSAFRLRGRRSSWDAPRRQAAWPAYHLRWAFVLGSAVMTSLLFTFPALFAGGSLSPWTSVAIAAVAGVGTTAAIWPRQLRYYAELRARAADSAS